MGCGCRRWSRSATRDSERTRMFEAVRKLIERASILVLIRQLLAILIDDLHWVDTGTLALPLSGAWTSAAALDLPCHVPGRRGQRLAARIAKRAALRADTPPTPQQIAPI
jgi:hypothetical protein